VLLLVLVAVLLVMMGQILYLATLHQLVAAVVAVLLLVVELETLEDELEDLAVVLLILRHQ
jgi:hypothetical protein